MRHLLPVIAFCVIACSNSVATTGGHEAGGGAGGSVGGGQGGGAGGGDGADGGGCTPPQLLVLLDRTGTMHRDLAGNTPPDTDAGHQSSKLYQAITAIDALVTTSQLDTTLQLGLALFPQDPGGGQCLTLSQRLQGQNFTNPACQMGQVVVAPAVGTGAEIAASIDPETTTLCFSTPTGNGLLTSLAELQSVQSSGVKQYVMLVTDGADFYASCPDPDPMAVLGQMHAAGVDTFILGFGGQDTTANGVNPPMLNRMACAGHTAPDFPNNCMPAGDGGYDAVNPDGGRLYYDAASSAELQTALQSIASKVCCGCIF